MCVYIYIYVHYIYVKEQVKKRSSEADKGTAETIYMYCYNGVIRMNRICIILYIHYV